eukprot:m.43677 g.43677  ORF g.43677 m.43677 type:complete len:472 (-) comp10787_c0_seq4:2935-4350(-)
MPICRSCCFRHKLSKMANPQTFPVKVKGILKGTTETEVYDSFRDAGCPFENCRVVDTDGYAHVNFSTLVEANKARDLLNANQIELKGQTLYCTGGEDKFNPGSFGSSAQPQTRRSRFKGPSTQASDDSPRAIVLTGMQSISEAKLLTDLQKLDGRVLSVKKTPNGTCFVNIHPSLSPREVIETLKGKAIEGVPLHATPYFDKSSNCAVYVSHIPPDIQTDQDLSAMLSKYGQVVAALLTRESDGRAHGTVQFSSPIEMEKAVEAFQGDETMKVTRFKSKKMRSADAMKDGEMKLQEWAQRTVHVQGVPIGTTQAEIVELFTPYQLDVCKVFPPRDGHSTTSGMSPIVMSFKVPYSFLFCPTKKKEVARESKRVIKVAKDNVCFCNFRSWYELEWLCFAYLMSKFDTQWREYKHTTFLSTSTQIQIYFSLEHDCCCCRLILLLCGEYNCSQGNAEECTSGRNRNRRNEWAID